MKLILLRHGESMGNAWPVAYNNDDTNFLSPRGVKEAQLAGDTIMEMMDGNKFDLVATSEVTRARHTTATVLHEMNDWKRMPDIFSYLNEWGHNTDGDANWKAGRETQEEFNANVTKFFNNVLVPQWTNDISFLVVSHFYTMTVLFNEINKYLGNPTQDVLDLESEDLRGIPNALPFHIDTALMDHIERIDPGHFSKRH